MRHRCAPSVVPCYVHTKGGIMPNLESYFGVNVHEEFTRYLVSVEFQKWLDTNYPGDTPSISFALFNNDFRSEWDWRDPFGNLNHLHGMWVIWGDTADAMAPDGTMNNVESKLRFVLREGLDSVEAETNLHLVQPGDFPWQGAGTYRGFTGGVSGRKKREDWLIYCHLINHLIDLMNQVATEAFNACEVLRHLPNCPLRLKYMTVVAFKRGFDPTINLREFFGETIEDLRALEFLTTYLQLKTFADLFFLYAVNDLEPNAQFYEGHVPMEMILRRIHEATFSFAA